MSAFLALTDAVVAALLASPALAGGRVRRGRQVPVGAGEPNGIGVNVLRSRAEPVDLAGGTLQWETAVGVAVATRATAGQDAEAAVDPLLQQVWARLYGMTPPAGALSAALDTAIDWDVDEAETTVAQATLTVRITHLTTGAALAAA